MRHLSRQVGCMREDPPAPITLQASGPVNISPVTCINNVPSIKIIRVLIMCIIAVLHLVNQHHFFLIRYFFWLCELIKPTSCLENKSIILNILSYVTLFINIQHLKSSRINWSQVRGSYLKMKVQYTMSLTLEQVAT